MAVDAGDGSHAPAVALYEGSVARFLRAEGGAALTLTGPSRVLLASDGIRSFGAPAGALFHELRFFGGPLPPATTVRTISPRLIRALAPESEPALLARGRQDIALTVPAGASAGRANLQWRPEAAVAAAHTLKVMLRAPIGARVTLVLATPADGSKPLPEISAVVAQAAAAGGREPGVAQLALALPTAWFDHLPEGVLTLAVELPGGPAEARAWFDGLALVFGPTPNDPTGGRDG